ncbi:hypothetical protein WISP_02513 [Willisornis vidua]|uniref:Uncharacterized protein n=1 Tax=Willisornis vidua TaxID=1566151 RepID=A0ABQ9DZN0_9PASS|nr:hypothetical protein WISP_02513 [Willisornis vidua]
MDPTLLLAWHSSPGTTSSTIRSALPMTSYSQEVGTNLSGSLPSMKTHLAYSFGKWINFCSFKRQKRKLAVGPCWTAKMDFFLENICNSKIHVTQNRAGDTVAKLEDTCLSLCPLHNISSLEFRFMFTGKCFIMMNNCDTDKATECTRSKFADNTKLSGEADMPEGMDAIQRDQDKHEKWACVNHMRLNKAKCKVLHLGWGSTWYQSRLGDEQPCKEGLGIAGGTKQSFLDRLLCSDLDINVLP